MDRLAGAAIALISLASSGVAALDARDPDPLSVLEAAYAAWNFGNIDASMAFLTDDAELIDSRGRKTLGARRHAALVGREPKYKLTG